jgi:RNA polymerase sigma factor (sigma-70 family)
MNKARGQVDEDDLLQAAMVGLIEAVDRYDPEKGYAFVTYACWWINKLISEEIVRLHWSTVRPPKRLWRDYLYRKMNDGQQDDYISTFMSFGQAEDTMRAKTDEEHYLAGNIMDAVADAKLTISEEVVFRMMYDPNTPPAHRDQIAEELGVGPSEVTVIEVSAMGKIRAELGIE